MTHLSLFGLCSTVGVSTLAASVSIPVPGTQTANVQQVLTFIAEDSPGQPCVSNPQDVAEVANTHRVPIQLLPTSLSPRLSAPDVFCGTEVMVADGKAFNGAIRYQIVADVLDMESVPKRAQSALLFQNRAHKDFDALKATITARVNSLLNHSLK